jgi:hypothetical protein
MQEEESLEFPQNVKYNSYTAIMKKAEVSSIQIVL